MPQRQGILGARSAFSPHRVAVGGGVLDMRNLESRLKKPLFAAMLWLKIIHHYLKKEREMDKERLLHVATGAEEK
jgi:hypothetical protein